MKVKVIEQDKPRIKCGEQNLRPGIYHGNIRSFKNITFLIANGGYIVFVETDWLLLNPISPDAPVDCVAVKDATLTVTI
jgi:hypothetical protein